MSDLGDFMDKLLRRPGTGAEPASVRDVARAHLAEYGSGRKAAKVWGINESTFRRILSGKTSSPKASTVAAAYNRERERSARRIRNEDIRIPATERRPSRRKGDAGRQTELTAKKLKITDPAAADRIRQAYLSGGPEAAALQLLKEIGDPHYRRWLMPDSLREATRRAAQGGPAGGGGGGGGAGGEQYPAWETEGAEDDPGSHYGYGIG